jgi:ribonuclease-3
MLQLLENSYDKINLDVLFSDYKTALQEITQSMFGSIPEYKLEKSFGPDHQKEFEVSIWIDEKNYGTAKGKSKKLAQQAVAKIALEKLKETQL